MSDNIDYRNTWSSRRKNTDEKRSCYQKSCPRKSCPGKSCPLSKTNFDENKDDTKSKKKTK